MQGIAVHLDNRHICPSSQVGRQQQLVGLFHHLLLLVLDEAFAVVQLVRILARAVDVLEVVK